MLGTHSFARLESTVNVWQPVQGLGLRACCRYLLKMPSEPPHSNLLEVQDPRLFFTIIFLWTHTPTHTVTLINAYPPHHMHTFTLISSHIPALSSADTGSRCQRNHSSYSYATARSMVLSGTLRRQLHVAICVCAVFSRPQKGHITIPSRLTTGSPNQSQWRMLIDYK